VQIFIHTLHVLKSDLLPQHHLVESSNEEGIQETTMEDSQTDHSANELEVIEMLGVHTRVGINLQCIIIVGGVFEETVERVEHFVREEEEKFTREVSIENESSNKSKNIP
jgi:hypothetical protein